MVANYEKSIEVQEDSFAQSKAPRQRLGELFDLAEEILNEELDAMMDRIKNDHSGFYKDYQENRVIRDL